MAKRNGPVSVDAKNAAITNLSAGSGGAYCSFCRTPALLGHAHAYRSNDEIAEAVVGRRRVPIGPMKRIHAGVLDVSYFETGSNDGEPVILRGAGNARRPFLWIEKGEVV